MDNLTRAAKSERVPHEACCLAQNVLQLSFRAEKRVEHRSFGYLFTTNRTVWGRNVSKRRMIVCLGLEPTVTTTTTQVRDARSLVQAPLAELRCRDTIQARNGARTNRLTTEVGAATLGSAVKTLRANLTQDLNSSDAEAPANKA